MRISTRYSIPSTANTVLPVPKSNNAERSNVWAVILAGAGRLPIRSFAPSYPGGHLPTHSYETSESKYVINQTREKVALAVPPERTMIAVSTDHLNYTNDVLGEVPCKNLVVGPEDDGTIFAILHSLFRVRKKDPNATVAFFPADLNVPDTNSFMRRIHDAVEAVHRRPRLILLGIEPISDDQGQEWIEPDRSAPIHEDLRVAKVDRLLSKVPSHEVRELIRRGGLWNSSVMVGRIWTFLREIRRVRPDLYTAFKAAEPMIGTKGEGKAIRSLRYEDHAETDFSRGVLKNTVDDLGVIPVASVKVKAAGQESPVAAKWRHQSETSDFAMAAAAGA